MRSEESVLYVAGQLPVFQNRMYDTFTEARHCLRGDMKLVQNMKTGLIYNAEFNPEVMVYDDHYQNEQAVSLVFQRHLIDVADIVLRNMGNSELVEVGCGKGYFLKQLLDKGCDVTGFDPAYEGDEPKVKKCYLPENLGFKAKGLILRHVLEHVQNPFHFLRDICEANDGKGIVYIEVPCFDWIVSHKAWYDVFYEHVNYFRLVDFYAMFDRVIDSGRFFNGQYLYVVADLATLKEPVFLRENLAVFPVDFCELPMSIGKAAIWGGASKGVIFSLFMERLGRPVDVVVDINPAKQGKYLPATGLQVYSPEQAMNLLDAGDPIYVMNSAYLEEIQSMTSNKYNLVGIDL